MHDQNAQEVRDEDFNNRSIRSVVCFRHVALSITVRAESPSCTISLTPSTPSPQLVGQRVVWTATAANCGAAPVYQYKVAITSASPKFRMARDFSLTNTLASGASARGPYAVMVTVKSGFNAARFDFRCCVVRDPLACNRGPSRRHANAQPASGSV